jgi:hypothetical protein
MNTRPSINEKAIADLRSVYRRPLPQSNAKTLAREFLNLKREFKAIPTRGFCRSRR